MMLAVFQRTVTAITIRIREEQDLLHSIAYVRHIVHEDVYSPFLRNISC